MHMKGLQKVTGNVYYEKQYAWVSLIQHQNKCLLIPFFINFSKYLHIYYTVSKKDVKSLVFGQNDWKNLCLVSVF